MDIFTKAKELGELISNSDEMTNYKKWEASLERDHKARAILREYQYLQTEMVRAAQEDKDKSVIDDIKERLLSKFDEINNNEITRNYIESKEKLDRLIKKLMMCWFIQFPAKSLVRQMTAVHAAAVEINLCR